MFNKIATEMLDSVKSVQTESIKTFVKHDELASGLTKWVEGQHNLAKETLGTVDKVTQSFSKMASESFAKDMAKAWDNTMSVWSKTGKNA
jgi:hypothetical protein